MENKQLQSDITSEAPGGTLEAAMNKKSFDDYFTLLMRAVAISMSLFHFVTAFRVLPGMEQRSAHLGFALVLVFMQSFLKTKSVIGRIITVIFIIGSIAANAYVFLVWRTMSGRVAFPEQLDLIFAAILIIALLEATRRRLGIVLSALGALFIAYAYFGNLLPRAISHRGYSLTRILSFSYMDTFGIFGHVLGISATFIFLFILFGAFLEHSGAGRFFIDLAMACVGKQKGGSAKVATIASYFFGMASGSAAGNVMAVGPLTVPLMEQSGYSKRFAGAVISVAGTGGQFTPPIMGAAGFIIAESLGIPYLRVASAALIPGFLYYLAIIFTITCRSNKMQLKGLETVPALWPILRKDFYLAAPILVLVYGLAIARWSPMRSGLYGIIAMFLVSLLRKETRMGPKKLAAAFEKAAMSSLEVACVCALAGIIIGMLSMTGLGLRFSALLVALAGGQLIVLLLLTMLAGLVIGLGMTTTSVYIILSVLVAPALVDMGVPVLAAHLFVFYFGILSALTPPVATASFAAASVAQDDPMGLSFAAWRLGLSGYILPFFFIFNPALIMDGTWGNIIIATVMAMIGIFMLTVALEGYYKYHVNLVFRVMLFVGALCLIYSGWLQNVIGLVILLVTLLPQYLKARVEKI